MKNHIFFMLKSKIELSISGNNIERFIKRLKTNNIEILNIKYISKNTITIKIYKQDYDDIINLKTIYDMKVMDYLGIYKYKKIFKNNKIIIITIIISLVIIYFITNMIFTIDIITNDSNMSNKLTKELNRLGIEKYKFKKSYDELQIIKTKILNNHKDDLEWIEIDNIGTKYIVRYEPRILNNKSSSDTFQNIIAKKNAIIKHFYISNGQIIKEINSYVKKGDIIVSGYIKLNDSIKDTVSSKGLVYGEVWYNVTVTYPYNYYEKIYYGKKKNTIGIKFLNNMFDILCFDKKNISTIKEITLLKNILLPIKLVIKENRKVKIIDEKYNEEELINKSIEVAKNKIQAKLKDGEYIDNYKIISKVSYEKDMVLNIFFTVVEDITELEKIEKYIDDNIKD